MPGRALNSKKGFFIRLPEELMARVYADLYSEVEECVPYGKVGEFFEALVREHYRARTEQTAPAPESGGATFGSDAAASETVVTAEGSMTCPSCLYEYDGKKCNNCEYENGP